MSSAKRIRLTLKDSNGFRQYGAGFMTARIIRRVSGLFLSGERRNSKDVETMATNKTYPSLTADEAAALIPNGAMVAVSGFTPRVLPSRCRGRSLDELGNCIRRAQRSR